MGQFPAPREGRNGGGGKGLLPALSHILLFLLQKGLKGFEIATQIQEQWKLHQKLINPCACHRRVLHWGRSLSDARGGAESVH